MLTHTDDILLNIDLVYSHKKDFLLYLTLLINTGFKCDMQRGIYTCNNIDLVNTTAAAKMAGMTWKTARKYIKQYSNIYEYCGRIAPLPRKIYFKLLEDLKDTPVAERNGIVRLFCYFVCMCWTFQDFSRKQFSIVSDLGSTARDVTRRTTWLIQHHYINMKHGHVHFAGKEAHPRVYQLYIDEVPSHYVGTEWWTYQLAERESQSIDDVLKEFRNSF